jgi:hypothetical protein
MQYSSKPVLNLGYAWFLALIVPCDVRTDIQQTGSLALEFFFVELQVPAPGYITVWYFDTQYPSASGLPVFSFHFRFQNSAIIRVLFGGSISSSLISLAEQLSYQHAKVLW